MTHRAISALWRHVGFVCAGLVLVYCLLHVFDPPRLNWGDSNSDYNVMVAGRNFDRYGFLNLKLTPHLLDAPLLQGPDDQVMIYTHYPQLPDLANGALRRVFGLSELYQFRLVALAFTFCSLFFVYGLLRRYWGRETAQIALSLWVINPLWIQHADYLHHEPFGVFFGFGAVYWLVRYLDDPARRRWLVLSAVFTIFTMWASYDYWMFVPALLAIVTIGHHRALFRARPMAILGLLAACTIAAVAAKFATNAWGLGGVDALLADMKLQFAERATDKVVRSYFDTGVWPTLYGRVERFFSLLLFGALAFWAGVPLLRRTPSLRENPLIVRATSLPNPCLVLLAALPFLIVFREIWIGQYYPTLLVLPFYAIALGAIVVLLLESARRSARIMAGVLLFALAMNSLDEDARFKKAFFQEQDVQSLRATLNAVSRPGQQILIDHVFDGFYRYQFDRETVPLILNPPGVVEVAIASFSDPRVHLRAAPPTGTIFVQHKHLTDEMFDKGYYYIFARYRLWPLWGNPPKYRAVIDSLIADRDSVLMSKVARVGHKIAETEAYAVWRIPTLGAAADTSFVSDAETPRRTPRN